MTPRRHKRRLSVRRTLCGLTALAAVACSSVAQDGKPNALKEELNAMEPPQRAEHLLGLVAAGTGTARVYFYLGNALYAQQLMDSAVGYYQQAIEADSLYSKAWVNMGIAYDGMERGIAARRAYESAITINPNDVLAYCHLGYNYFTRGRTDQAVKNYQLALKIDPNSAQAHYNLGLAFADAKMFSEALVEWEQVVELDPDGELGKIARENVEIIRTYMELEQE